MNTPDGMVRTDGYVDTGWYGYTEFLWLQRMVMTTPDDYDYTRWYSYCYGYTGLLWRHRMVWLQRMVMATPDGMVTSDCYGYTGWL